jgi:hypothetical protein
MSKLLYNLLSFVVNRLIDAKLFESIKDLVAVQMNSKLSGDQKKAAVKAELAELQGNVRTEFEKTASNLVNFAIEAAVLIIKK